MRNRTAISANPCFPTLARHLGVLALGALVLFPAQAAAKRKSPLEGAPAVRHRYELRDKRFAIGPSVSFSINRALRHSILIGGKLEFHINDYIAIGGEVGAGIGIDTGLAGELEQQAAPGAWDLDQADTCGDATTDRTRHCFSDIQLAGDARLTFTPFAGKMAVFGKLFFAYDFYAFSGFGFGMTKNNTDDSGVDEANETFRPGFAWGVGMRMYFAKFFAMGLELKDLIFSDNESGGDLTRGLSDTERGQNNALVIDGDDSSLVNHFFLSLSFTFYFPTTPKISN